MNMQPFINYVMSFYGPNELHGEFFDNSLTSHEVTLALELRLQIETLPPFDGDSFDRELVRDILLLMRGKTDVEYSVALKSLKLPRSMENEK